MKHFTAFTIECFKNWVGQAHPSPSSSYSPVKYIRLFCALFDQCVLLSSAIVSGMRDRAATSAPVPRLRYCAELSAATTEFSADFSEDQCFELSFASAPCETHLVTEIFRNFLEK